MVMKFEEVKKEIWNYLLNTDLSLPNQIECSLENAALVEEVLKDEEIAAFLKSKKATISIKAVQEIEAGSDAHTVQATLMSINAAKQLAKHSDKTAEWWIAALAKNTMERLSAPNAEEAIAEMFEKYLPIIPLDDDVLGLEEAEAQGEQALADAIAQFPQGQREVVADIMEVWDGLKKDPAPLVIEIPLVSAFQIISQLQLALRHPVNKGSAAIVARNFCTKAIQLIGDRHPKAAEILNLGWNPKYDAKVEDHP